MIQNCLTTISVFCVQPATASFGLVTTPVMSIMDSFGTLEQYLTMPLLMSSAAVRIHWMVAYYYLILIKSKLPPAALDPWSLPRTVMVLPSSDSLTSWTCVNSLVNLSSGSPWDLLSSFSPNKCALGSFGSFSIVYACTSTFFYLWASLSCFLASLSFFFGASAASSLGISPSAISSSENTWNLGSSAAK